MATYLLTWNPATGTEWTNISEDARRVRQGRRLRNCNWSCGNRRSIEPKSKFFLIRQGKDRPGLVAHGQITSRPYEDDHWDEERAEQGDKAWYIRFEPDYIVDIETEDPLDVARSHDRTIRNFPWGAQASGIIIPEPTASKVHVLWQEFTNASTLLRREIPSELDGDKGFPEGAKMRVLVNRYERKPLAREKCLAHYGRGCIVCGMTFAETYGEAFAKIIEVHHVKKLSTLGENYDVDPVRDLRPVCPNCHAALHVADPPLSLETLQKIVNRSQ